MLVKPELFLNLSQVIFLAVILVLLENLHASSAVARSDMLDEHGTITDKLSFKCVNEWAVSAIETIRAADLMDGKYELAYLTVVLSEIWMITYWVDVILPVILRFDHDLYRDIWAVLLQELTKHLTLQTSF